PRSPASSRATRSRTSRTGPTRSASSSGASRRRAPRSTTPAWSRTPASARACSATSSHSARPCATSRPSRAACRSPRAPRSSSTGTRGGRASSTRTRPTACATDRRRPTGTRRSSRPASVPTATDLAGYDVVVAPVLHVVPAALRDRLTAFVEGGGHLVTTYFSGVVDQDDHAWLGGYPGALRDLLGIRVEEFAPLLDGESA